MNSIPETVLSQISGLPARLILESTIRNQIRKEVFSGPDAPLHLRKEAEKSLRSFQDKGYPFASFHYDSIRFEKNAAVLSGRLDQGPRILNGSLIIHGDSNISTELMARTTGFRKGDDFSLSAAERIPALVNALSFAESVKSPELEWFGNQAVLHLYLRKSSANFLNGILGLLPGQGKDNQLLLTGNLEAGFSNLFSRGISFSIRWARFAPESQQAYLSLDWPALNYSGLGFSGRFELFRQDSLYFSQKAAIEMMLPISGIGKIRAGMQLYNSFQKGISGSASLSQTVNSLVLGLDLENASANRINPSRNFFSLRLFPGLKIREEGKTRNQLSQVEFRARTQAALWKIGRRLWVRGNGDLGMLFSDGLSIADQFRMGGIRTFRGFNENQFFTSGHFLLGLQPSFLLDSGFLFSVFGEMMFFESGFFPLNLHGYRQALGFGLSAEFEAGPNLIQISLANGWMNGLTPELGGSKIHFGYVARF